METKKRIQDYVAAYKKDFTFTHIHRTAYEQYGIAVTVDVYEYSDTQNYREAAHLLLEKGAYCYECDCVKWNE